MKYSNNEIIIIAIAILNSCCTTGIQNNSAEKKTKIDSIYGIMISSGTIEDNCFDYIEKEIKYSRCTDEKNNNNIVYTDTKDKKYISPEGVYIGMSFNKVKKISKQKLVQEPGWVYYFPLKSGWNAAFVLDKETAYQTITKDSLVAFIFKRK